MKTLIEMVHEVYGEEKYWTEEQLLQLKALAALVRSNEREACAKVCEGINSAEDYYGARPELICAEAIRARSGEQK